MFTSHKSLRIVAVVLAAFLMVTGLQSSASAATKRSLSISAAPAVSVSGTSVVFSGKLTKSPKGTKVTIQRKSGSKWVTAGKTKTKSAAGTYSLRLKRPSSLGNYSYRAIVAKKGKLKAAKSKTVTVAALRRTLISLSSSTASTTAGSNVTLSGTVLPSVTGATVTLQRKLGTKWSNVTTTKVSPNGTYSKGVVPATSTVYRAVVSRASLNAPGTSNERTVKAKPLITTGSLPKGKRFTDYSVKLTSYAGAVGTWSTPAAPAEGSLPSGLSLNASTGVISGKPTSKQTKQVVVGFKHTATGLSAAPKTYQLDVLEADAPVISTGSLPDATRLSPYSVALKAAGDPVGTWSVPLVGEGSLPAGLSLNTSTGVISGTPPKAAEEETKSVSIKFKQTNTGLEATKVLVLKVKQAAAPEISTTAIPAGSVAVAYSTKLAVTGNPAGTWATTAPLPAWLSLNESTGVLSGTPPESARATDINVAVRFTQTSTGLSDTATLTLRINPGDNPVISTTSLPNGKRFTAYSTTLTAMGGFAGTWSASPLPAGLTLNTSTGAITGTPTVAGTTEVVVGFTRTSNGLAAEPKTFQLTIAQADAPVISTASLKEGTRLAAYSDKLTAANNPAGTWSASPLPAGLSLNTSTGAITGTPTAAGETSVEVGFTQTSTGLAATPKTLVLRINQAAAPVISTASLKDGIRTVAYSEQLTAVGSPAGTWTASPLPAGLTLNASTGAITGTPTTAGATSVVIGFTQTNTGLAAAEKTLVLTVVQPSPPTIATVGLPNGVRLSPYSTTLIATGNPAGTWTASPLPAGLTLNESTGAITGTPTTVETKQVEITFTETSTGLSAAKTLSLVINQAAPPVITTAATLKRGGTAISYSTKLEVAGNPAGVWSLIGGRTPPGISLKSNGVVSGACILPGTYTFTAKFTQTSTGVSASKEFSLKIS